MKLKFNRNYFALALLLLGVEILIAKFVHDTIIRPYIGDLLVVVLIYCLVKAFVEASVYRVALGVLIFSFFVEMLQYFKIVNLLGLQDNRLAKIIIGTSFSWMDMLAYSLGIALVLLAEKAARLYHPNSG